MAWQWYLFLSQAALIGVILLQRRNINRLEKRLIRAEVALGFWGDVAKDFLKGDDDEQKAVS